jgi:hypothetical protein
MKRSERRTKNPAAEAGSGKTTILSTLCTVALWVGGSPSFGYSFVSSNLINAMNHPLHAVSTVLGHPSLQCPSLLSFDLDDNFWSTKDVVRDANKSMIEIMKEMANIDASVDAFLQTTQSIRNSLKGPITYEGLRTNSIRKTLETSAYYKETSMKDPKESLDEIVDSCYNEWVQERRVAAERQLLVSAAIRSCAELPNAISKLLSEQMLCQVLGSSRRCSNRKK